ncbi:MAG: histidinol-phosphate transaminase [Candidatus Omnitrophota bacterium]|nr:MAG: histidinol-phosphate transaminase [Candidatus Omnitrophota bacterium]
MIKIDKTLRNIKGYIPGKPTEELKRELKLKEVYKLASNEIPFSPLYIKKAVEEELKNINRYPEGNCFYLRKKIAKKFRVKEDQIVFGNGSDEIVVLALRSFIRKKNEEVIVGFPTFLIYELQSKIHQAKVLRVPFKNYRYDLEGMLKAITKNTKVIFIANPDNPCGTYLSHKEIEEFLDRVPSQVLIFFDEAYYEFVDRKDFPKSLEFLKKRKNLIITRTFSKAYGLAGLRIGYAITSSSIAEILNKVREPFNVNRIAQRAALVALENKEVLKRVCNYIKKEREYLYQQLARLNLEFIKSVTNFILVNFKRDVDKLNSYFLKKGIIIRPLTSWGLKNFFRVTVGKHKENVKFIRELSNYLKKEEIYDYRI